MFYNGIEVDAVSRSKLNNIVAIMYSNSAFKYIDKFFAFVR
jgi:hypothetical protein